MRRVLCFLLALILAVSLAIVPTFASDSSDGYRDGINDYTWGDKIVKYEIAPIFDILNGVWNEANAFAENVTDTIREEVQANVLDGIEFWKDVVDALSYDNYVSTLDSTTASSSASVTGFTVTAITERLNTRLYFLPPDTSYLFVNSDTNFLRVLSTLRFEQDILIFAAQSSDHFYGLWFDGQGLLNVAYSVELGVNALDPACFGVWSIDDVTFSQSDKNGRVYYNREYADLYCASGQTAWALFPLNDDDADTWYNLDCWKRNSSGVWKDGYPYYAINYSSADYYYWPDYTTAIWNTATVIDQPSGTTSTSRPVSFASSITNYNTYNFYGDDATVVNYYIGSTDDSGELTGIFNFGIFDEDTMIFTDPETGTEYQATGWSYDYTTRTYDIAFDAGTMTVNDTDITRVLLTYGDEALTIQYYDTSGNLIDTRSYVYLQVAQTGCAINGHSYTYETIKEATCTHVGERKYTCSVCGDEYAEDIPMSEHASTFSVFKGPTCTESGIGLYSCSICGTEYTETIDALGHDWLEQDTIDTTYALPEGTSCPDCSGAEFSSELDEIAGVYVCICSGCGTEWEVDAVINYGETHYTCSVCGATRTESLDPDNGLFTAIGDLLADAVTWVTDKLAQLVDSLSGLNDLFQDYMEQIRESGGEYPAFLAAFVALLPEDLMAVLWFALIAVLVLAVWKKWFS